MRPAEHSEIPRAVGAAVLGPDHPLVRAIGAFQTVTWQLSCVAAVLIGSGIADLEGSSWAAAAAIGAGATLVLLTVVAAALRQRMRDRAVDVILAGGEHVTVAAVRRERERLLSARTRGGLAARFEEMVELSARPRVPRLPSTLPLYRLGVVARVRPELLALVRLLEADAVSARGVARAERVISDCMSPLYGRDGQPLREELRRVIRLLAE
jgi:hypothetical protein